MKSPNRREATSTSITRRLGIAALLLTLVTVSYGCLDDVTLCDGSDDIRLAYRTSGGGNVAPGRKLMSDNGYSFLYLDGQCRYWAFPRGDDGTSDSVWSEVVTGVLSAEQEEQLKEEISVVDWQRWDQETFREDSLSDGATALFWTPDAVFSCYGDCQNGARNDIRSNVRSWIEKLAEQGEPVDGEVRVLAVTMPESVVNQDRPHPVQPAPAGLDLGAHAFDEGEHYCVGDGVLVSGEAAEALRRYRREYTHGEHGDFWYSYLPIEADDGKQYMVYMRDVMPIEDSDGIVQLAGESTGACFR